MTKHENNIDIAEQRLVIRALPSIRHSSFVIGHSHHVCIG
jgi:hypothetical protein